MLDVHPAHHAATTWRDFFIHITTIVLGLLIAIGLEQTVEAVHHARERREVIEDMHNECTASVKVFAGNVATMNADHRWDIAAIAALEDAKPSGGFVTATLPKLPPGLQQPVTPGRAVWSIAQSNGKAALLPENLAEVYARLNLISESFLKARDRAQADDETNLALYTRLRIQLDPGASLHLTLAARDELVAALAVDAAHGARLAYQYATWSGACHAVLDGVQNRDDMMSYMERERNKADQH